MDSRSARPIVALARLPGPSAYVPEFISISRAIGPFTSCMNENEFVERTPEENGPELNASTAASNTGIAAGGAPAITPLMATFSTVTGQPSGANARVTISPAAWLVPLSMVATASSVGGAIGKPSVQ